MMINCTATETESNTVVVQVSDRGARKLMLAHLRAFVEQADRAGFPEDIEVKLEMALQATSPYYDIRIRSQVHTSVTTDLAPAKEA